jgi:hypothetical protein
MLSKIVKLKLLLLINTLNITNKGSVTCKITMNVK